MTDTQQGAEVVGLDGKPYVPPEPKLLPAETLAKFPSLDEMYHLTYGEPLSRLMIIAINASGHLNVYRSGTENMLEQLGMLEMAKRMVN